MADEKKAGLLNASARDGVQYRKASLFQMIVGTANAGTGVIFYLILGFATLIGPQGYGITTVLTGILLTALRMVDGVSDAVVAAIFEKLNPKRGKVRIMLLVGWAVAALASLALYGWLCGIFEGVLGVIAFSVAYILFDIGNTINGCAGGTVGIVITNDPTQRPMTNVIGTIYSYCVPMICTNLIAFVILPRHDNQYDVPMLTETMAWFAGLSLIFTVLACIGIAKLDVRETFETLPKDGEDEAEKTSVKDMWSVVKDNRNVQMYMLTGITDKLAQQTMSQGVVSTLMSGVLIGSYAAATMSGNVTQIVGVVFAFAGGIFIAKWGSKKATSVWSGINIAMAVVCVAMCVILCMMDGGSVEGMKALGVIGVPIIIFTILGIGRTGANMVLTTAGASMRADLVDYEYVRSGHYMPAVLAGVYSLIDKIVSSFASTIASLCIALVGYTTTVPQMGDKATWGIFWVAMFLQYGLAIIGWICNIIAMKFYTLDRETMIDVQKTLNERKAAHEASQAE